MNKEKVFLIFLSIFILSAFSLQAGNAISYYRQAQEHLSKGQQFFRQAMTSTHGGSDRANFCSQARQEYYAAQQQLNLYEQAGGDHETANGLRQQISINDYNAMKNAPSSVWSPPEHTDEPTNTIQESEPKSRVSPVILGIIIAIIVLGITGFVFYSNQNKQVSSRSRSGRSFSVRDPQARDTRSSRAKPQKQQISRRSYENKNSSRISHKSKNRQIPLAPQKSASSRRQRPVKRVRKSGQTTMTESQRKLMAVRDVPRGHRSNRPSNHPHVRARQSRHRRR